MRWSRSSGSARIPPQQSASADRPLACRSPSRMPTYRDMKLSLASRTALTLAALAALLPAGARGVGRHELFAPRRLQRPERVRRPPLLLHRARRGLRDPRLDARRRRDARRRQRAAEPRRGPQLAAPAARRGGHEPGLLRRPRLPDHALLLRPARGEEQLEAQRRRHLSGAAAEQPEGGRPLRPARRPGSSRATSACGPRGSTRPAAGARCRSASRPTRPPRATGASTTCSSIRGCAASAPRSSRACPARRRP